MGLVVFIGLDAMEFPENSRRVPSKLPVGLQGQQVQYNAPGSGSGQVQLSVDAHFSFLIHFNFLWNGTVQ
jgi:hypothetical protein